MNEETLQNIQALAELCLLNNCSHQDVQRLAENFSLPCGDTLDTGHPLCSMSSTFFAQSSETTELIKSAHLTTIVIPYLNSIATVENSTCYGGGMPVTCGGPNITSPTQYVQLAPSYQLERGACAGHMTSIYYYLKSFIGIDGSTEEISVRLPPVSAVVESGPFGFNSINNAFFRFFSGFTETSGAFSQQYKECTLQYNTGQYCGGFQAAQMNPLRFMTVQSLFYFWQSVGGTFAESHVANSTTLQPTSSHTNWWDDGKHGKQASIYFGGQQNSVFSSTFSGDLVAASDAGAVGVNLSTTALNNVQFTNCKSGKTTPEKNTNLKLWTATNHSKYVAAPRIVSNGSAVRFREERWANIIIANGSNFWEKLNSLSSNTVLLFMPGIYVVNDTINVTASNVILMGVGVARFHSNVPRKGAMMNVTGHSVVLASVLTHVAQTQLTHIEWAGADGYMFDVTLTAVRDGFNPSEGETKVNTMLHITSSANRFTGNNIWLWAGDHDSGGGSADNIIVFYGGVVDSVGSTFFGLYSEHFWCANLLLRNTSESTTVLFSQMEHAYTEVDPSTFSPLEQMMSSHMMCGPGIVLDDAKSVEMSGVNIYNIQQKSGSIGVGVTTDSVYTFTNFGFRSFCCGAVIRGLVMEFTQGTYSTHELTNFTNQGSDYLEWRNCHLSNKGV
jgi:hypothetical protein